MPPRDSVAGGIRRFSPLRGSAFQYWKRLADPAFFRLVRVAYGTLVWPDDIDIAPEDVWEKTVRDAPAAVLPAFVAEGPAIYDGKPV